MRTASKVYSRYSDGGLPVEILRCRNGKQRFRVALGSGRVLIFNTRRSLLAFLTGHPTGRNWTIERYFKLEEPSPSESVLDFLADVKSKPVLGVDLDKYALDIRKLFFAKWGRRVHDPEELLQELYAGLLVRNKGKCPWDPNKSSLSSYVLMVAGCVVSNFYRSHNRYTANEVMDTATCREDSQVSKIDRTGNTDSHRDYKILASNLGTLLDRPVRDVYELMLAGHSQKDIATKLEIKPSQVSRSVRLIRDVVRGALR